MTDTPEITPEITVGQRWGLWVYDDAMYTKLRITSLDDRTAFGVTDDGSPCAIGLERLRQRGDLLTSHIQFIAEAEAGLTEQLDLMYELGIGEARMRKVFEQGIAKLKREEHWDGSESPRVSEGAS